MISGNMPKQRIAPMVGRLHIWLGWIVGIPLLLWTATGLLMVSRPIEEVRGEHLRQHLIVAALPYEQLTIFSDSGRPFDAARLVTVNGDYRWVVSYPAERLQRRFDARTGKQLGAVSREEALLLARAAYGGTAKAETVRKFADQGQAPIELRKDRPSWRVAFADGTNLFIDADTGETLALRTRFWRVFDFAWGLHIMDPQTREDTHHPLLVASALLGLASVVTGWWLVLRRSRKLVNRAAFDPSAAPPC